MNLFFVITAWAFLEALQDPEPKARLFSPAVLFSFFREMTEIFLLTALTAGTLAAAEFRFPGSRDFLTASGGMLFYLYSRILNRRESFVWMAYACAVLFSHEKAISFIAFQSMAAAVGVTGIKMILLGVQKRRFLCPVPVLKEGMPAFFVTAALISLVCSSLFVR